MRKRIGWLLPAALLLTAVPGLAQWDWNQAYGNIGNSSFVNVATNIGVAPLWSVKLGGAVAWGGPSIGEGGTVYLGTTNGTFFAFRPNGSLRCSLTFPDRIYTSTPAVLPGGEVAIVFQRMASPGMQGFLTLLTADCKPLWEVELPRWNPEINSVASGSVKVWTLPKGGTFLFVHSRDSRQADITGPGLLTWDDLLVYTPDGQLFARHPVGEICLDVRGGGGFGDLWDYLTGWWPSAGEVPPLYQQFGWPDSTPAIMDANIRGYSSPSQPLVAVTGSCLAKLDVLRFRPAATTESDRLTMTWSIRADYSRNLLSSPAVTPEGQVVIGTSTHRLKVFDLGERRLIWEVDTKHPLMHPPAMAPGVWFAITEFQGWLVDPDTSDLVPTGRVQPMEYAGTLGASAASLTQAFIPNFDGMEVWSHDLQNLAHPLRNDDFLTSNPAVTPGGRVYVVGQTGDNGELFAFGPP